MAVTPQALQLQENVSTPGGRPCDRFANDVRCPLWAKQPQGLKRQPKAAQTHTCTQASVGASGTQKPPDPAFPASPRPMPRTPTVQPPIPLRYRWGRRHLTDGTGLRRRTGGFDSREANGKVASRLHRQQTNDRLQEEVRQKH